MDSMPPVEIQESQIVATAMSLGPCSPKNILDELGMEQSAANEARVVQILTDQFFTRHGGIWVF